MSLGFIKNPLNYRNDGLTSEKVGGGPGPLEAQGI